MKLAAATVSWIGICLMLPNVILGGNDETFTYKETDEADEEYGPEDWNRVGCDDLDQCAGWPDDWELGYDWGLENAQNSCRWCPQGSSTCGAHHQSPIDLKRNRAINDGSETHRQCIDWHWMKYEDGTCDAQQLRDANAYSIERHALKITIPYEEYDGPGPNEEPLEEHYEVGWQPTCTDRGGNHRWPRIDFSKGFPDWWFLSHTDVKIPSEHTQEGKRYSAEVQMYHFYSKSRNAPPDENGDPQENEMAAISVFLEAYDDSPVYDFLDRIICEWRNTEDKVRDECGMDSVGTPYPGCFNPQRGYTPFPSVSPTKAPIVPTPDPTKAPVAPTDAPTEEPTVGATEEPTESPEEEPTDPPVEETEPTDPPVEDAEPTPVPTDAEASFPTEVPIFEFGEPVAVSPTAVPPAANAGGGRRLGEPKDDVINMGRTRQRRVLLDHDNFREPDMTEDEWSEFIEATSAVDRGVATAAQRELVGQEHLIFDNYQWMIDCKTEYYFRYQGTQTVPPCWGRLIAGSRAQTNHWRIMKDPIRVHPRQIAEMERLIRDRIDPRRCRKDTAAKVERDGTVNVARPLQETAEQHFKVFCECFDFMGNGWSSKWPEDRTWCRSQDRDQLYRFYEHPYNFNSSGVF